MSRKHKKRGRAHTLHEPVTDGAYIVYTDGGCAVNPGGPGGATCVVTAPDGAVAELSRGYFSTTNNRMELTAVIMALEAIPGDAPVCLYSDSQYVLNCMSGAWSRHKNRDLWARFEAVSHGRQIETRWVPGHNGVPQNERCDELCTLAMQAPTLADPWQEQGGMDFSASQAHPQGQKASGGAMARLITLPEGYEERVPARMSVTEYTGRWHVRDVCAKAMLAFFAEGDRHSFRSYAALKSGGIDFWSRKSPDLILADEPQKDVIWSSVQAHLSGEKEQKSAVRWYGRGLPLKDAIRKALVDAEISENAMRN